jgi:hypothetical protein
MFVNGKTSDMCQCQYQDIDVDGYVPKGLPFSDQYGDYIEFHLCLECGRMQGKFPISDAKVKKAIESV